MISESQSPDVIADNSFEFSYRSYKRPGDNLLTFIELQRH
jgi:hypothetical protein